MWMNTTTNMTRMFQAKSMPRMPVSKNITTPRPQRIPTCTPNPKSASPNRMLLLHRISATSTIPLKNILRATIAAARHAMIEAAKTSAVETKVEIAAAKAAIVAVADDGDVVVDAVAADAPPAQEVRLAVATCRHQNTPRLKVEISNVPANPVADTISAASSPAVSNLAVNNRAALTIAARKPARVP
jgi:hypothetical protein